MAQKISEFIAKRFSDVDNRQAAIEAKLDHVLLNQELLGAYLGLTPGGATSEDLSSLGERIKTMKERIAAFDKQVTGS